MSRLSKTPALAAVLAMLPSCTTADRSADRARMMASIAAVTRDIPAMANDPGFIAALEVEARLPRERFVPKAARPFAYIGAPLNIGWEQTISDPYIVAMMTAAAKVGPSSKVLEIGTGSGYQAAVLAERGARVWTIEIIPELATRAARTLRRLGYRQISARAGDGFAGWPDHAPFDAVIVTAGAARVPQLLLDQLKVGGRLVMPIGPSTPTEQLLVHTKRPDGGFDICSLGRAMFVPLMGSGRTAERPGIVDRTKPWCYGASVT